MRQLILAASFVATSFVAVGSTNAQTLPALQSENIVVAQRACPKNAYRGKTTGKCFCKKGYKWNSARTKCYKVKRGSSSSKPRGSY